MHRESDDFRRLADLDEVLADYMRRIGSLSGPEINGQNNNAIWSEGDNGLELIAREGNSAPGTCDSLVRSLLPGYISPVFVDAYLRRLV